MNNIRYLLLIIAFFSAPPGLCAEDSPTAALAPTAVPAPAPIVLPPAPAALSPYAPTSIWAVCPPPPDRDYQLHDNGDPQVSTTALLGNLAERSGDGKLTLIGDAEATRGYQRLRANKLIYDELDKTVEAEGGVIYDEPLLNIRGINGKFWLDEDRGELFTTHFNLYGQHGRGDAKKAYIVRPGVTRFKKALYTTCPQDSNAWSMHANRVTLNKNTGVGVARNARLNLKGVPVLYTPYISFPLDDRRKTGFLMASFGSSDKSGFELKTPFYWNIAPNYDATITPRYLQNRGTQVNSEFRFLQPGQKGLVHVEYLDKDDITDDTRSRIIVRNAMRFSPNLTANINYDRVSDKDYLIDLGDSLKLASVTHLKRTGQINYTTSWWQLGLQVDDYQTVDKTITKQNRPYQRLPRIALRADSPIRPGGIETQLTSEIVRFDASQRVTANRIDLWPSASLPIRGAAFDSTPKIGLRYTSYKLENQISGNPDNPDRSTPFFSMDNTLYLERNFAFGTNKYTQTLEPRLFYLYVKGDNQKDLPLFDTSAPTFTYRELFEENRFNGADRMGDANQAALALTTRFIDPDSGAEKLRASVGQLYYFANRNVMLNNSAPETDSTSDIAAELELALSSAWSGKIDLIWDPQSDSTQRANARIQYRPGYRKIINLSYRFLKDSQNQIDASVLWPLSPNWHVVGRWYYDINDSQKLETLAGIEYDNCCWGIRFLTRDFIDSGSRANNIDSRANNRIYMAQFVLKGLATFGSKIESILGKGVLGYTERPIN
ncbi:LPS-assembly protein LptD @ Organic solvent tolerance protein precursor [hydrothermal vent metagenome]|uniref:LPS-assembly protein LptD @ Organic solvent tolerance protein n=1 Tax=hydrothermal vent metagenome TaxID=652676 RepID=A0A3B0YTH0_9ZZZZ